MELDALIEDFELDANMAIALIILVISVLKSVFKKCKEKPNNKNNGE